MVIPTGRLLIRSVHRNGSGFPRGRVALQRSLTDDFTSDGGARFAGEIFARVVPGAGDAVKLGWQRSVYDSTWRPIESPRRGSVRRFARR